MHRDTIGTGGRENGLTLRLECGLLRFYVN